MRKAEYSMLVTESGIMTDSREEQLEKAYFPMLVTESGIMTDSREEQPEKALSGIVSAHPNSMLEPLPMGPAVLRL